MAIKLGNFVTYGFDGILSNLGHNVGIEINTEHREFVLKCQVERVVVFH